MSIMAKHSQIIWADPIDADVDARNKAVAALQVQLAGQTTFDAIRTAGAIADGFAGDCFPAHLSATVESAISKESPAFVLKGKELQGTVCLAVAALAFVEQSPIERTGWQTADALAAALWSALAFQDQVENGKLEELRGSLMLACRDRIAAVAKEARVRHDVPDVGTLSIPEADPAGNRANAAYRKATAPVIAALKSNQELDREEINFLWWVLADHSSVLECPLETKGAVPRAVAAGLEGAQMLRRLPGDGYRHAALRRIGMTEELSITAMLAAVGEDRARLTKDFTGGWAIDIPTVFPLLAALCSTQDVKCPAMTLDARGWGARALLEASIVAMESRFAGGA